MCMTCGNETFSIALCRPRYPPEPRAEQNGFTVFLRPIPVFHLASSWMSLLSLAAVRLSSTPSTANLFLQRLGLVPSPFHYMSRPLCPPFTALYTATIASLLPTLFGFATTHPFLSSSLPTDMNNALVKFICIPDTYYSKDVHKPPCSLRRVLGQHKSTPFRILDTFMCVTSPIRRITSVNITSVPQPLTCLQQTLRKRCRCRRQLYLPSFTTCHSRSPSLLPFSTPQPFSLPLSLGLRTPQSRLFSSILSAITCTLKLLDRLDAV